MRNHKKIKYTDEPIGKIALVPDFLPRPEELVIKEESVKVTLSLSKASVDYFKELAEQEHAPYQKMIRVLLDKYVSYYHQQ